MERKAEKVVPAKEMSEGDGAKVYRSVGLGQVRYVDPFLMLDEVDVALPAGFPDHPHRGFETVTYVLGGSVKHEDFAGHRDVLQQGDVQAMTAGRGVVHAEMPNPNCHGLQLWVNLKLQDKMISPDYRTLQSSKIPRVERDKVSCTIISGSAMGVEVPSVTKTPISFLDFLILPGAEFQQPIPNDWGCFAYVLAGDVHFGEQKVSERQVAVFGNGDNVKFSNPGGSPVRFILVSGEKIHEPVSRHGPFVMTNDDEIEAALADYRSFRNGFEKAKNWKSKIGGR